MWLRKVRELYTEWCGLYSSTDLKDLLANLIKDLVAYVVETPTGTAMREVSWTTLYVCINWKPENQKVITELLHI